MEYNSKKYRGETIIQVPGEEIGSSCDHYQVYFKDGSRSKLIYSPEKLIDAVKDKGYYENYSNMLVWEKDDMNVLTSDNIKSIIGKRIYFECPAGSGNETYKGIGVIKSVDYSKRNPIEWEHESGDSMQFAGFDGYNNFWLSDEGRNISIKEL